jgi:hypothetical protein
MGTTRERGIGAAVLAGALAGLIAGLVLAAFMTLLNVASGLDPWIGAKMAGAPFLGERALRPGFDAAAVLVGVVSHLGVSAAWGAVFGLLFLGLSTGTTVAAGLAWGVVVWIVMYYIVLPLAGLGALARAASVPIAVLNHLVFGLALALGFVRRERRVAPGAFAPWIDDGGRRGIRTA